MELAPQLPEANVVLAAAERAGAMACRERGRLVEEEELRELAGLQQRAALPASELEPARDPALHAEPLPDATGVVVQAAAVPVDEAARRVGDELAERRHAVLKRHPPDATRLASLHSCGVQAGWNEADRREPARTPRLRARRARRSRHRAHRQRGEVGAGR